ncbi:MAG: transglutaminase-like domain-containing protein [Candidatus Thermoplasmatota archaeon]|jgi:hypothetical protein|nr:transglutaminase-like domain-containing protein [Candidatus Thermoplasmatota archaeon]
MNKKIVVTLVLLIIFLINCTTGCMDYFGLNDGGLTYEKQPVKISYNIRYGYEIDCSGTGSFRINYECDLPEVLIGSAITKQIIYPYNYTTINLANNAIAQWNISGKNKNSYKLGVSATVVAEGVLVSDLNGVDALTLDEIKTFYPDVFSQYTKEQSVNNTIYIDPNNEYIKLVAQNIKNQANTNNSFVIAKKLFIWLKQNTSYRTHITDVSVQPAGMTITEKTGDCDDLSFLYISLCRSVGIPARFIRGFLVDLTNNNVTGAVAHAWVEVFVGGNIGNSGWIPVECACPSKDMNIQVNQNFGVETADHLRLFQDDGSNMSMNMSISGPKVFYENHMHIDMTPFVEIEDFEVLEEKMLFVDSKGYRTYKTL